LNRVHKKFSAISAWGKEKKSFRVDRTKIIEEELISFPILTSFIRSFSSISHIQILVFCDAFCIECGQREKRIKVIFYFCMSKNNW